MTVRLGVVMLPTDPWPQAVARAQHLERLGFDHVWTYDHLSWRRFHDSAWFGAVPWLTGIAMATGNIRLGTMVATPNFRHPVTFAKEVMTLDHISAGRALRRRLDHLRRPGVRTGRHRRRSCRGADPSHATRRGLRRDRSRPGQHRPHLPSRTQPASRHQVRSRLPRTRRVVRRVRLHRPRAARPATGGR